MQSVLNTSWHRRTIVTGVLSGIVGIASDHNHCLRREWISNSQWAWISNSFELDAVSCVMAVGVPLSLNMWPPH